MIKKEAQPRMLWSYQETEDLIDIIQAKYLHRILSNKNGRKYPLFNEIKEEFDKFGYNKGAQQIVFKWKNLCSMYRYGVNNFGGKPPMRDKRYEFFDKMYELFEGVNNTGSMNGEEYTFNDYARSNDDENNQNFQHQEIINITTSVTSADDIHTDAEIEDIVYEEEEEEENSTMMQQNSNIESKQHEKILLTSINKSLKRDYEDNYVQDPLTNEWTQSISEPPSAKKSKLHFKKDEMDKVKSTANTSKVNTYEDVFLETLRSENSPTYTKSVDYLVTSFKNAQNELQNKFYSQQLKLQQQQQEWEEKVLDEEREYFAKILKAMKTPQNDEY